MYWSIGHKRVYIIYYFITYSLFVWSTLPFENRDNVNLFMHEAIDFYMNLNYFFILFLTDE